MDGFINGQKLKILKGHTNTQALVEGDIPFPDGMELRKILDHAGTVELSMVNVYDGMVKIEGRIKIDMAAENKEGEIVSFFSWANLEHEIICSGAESENEANVKTRIQSLNTHIKDGAIKLSAVVDIEAFVIKTEAANSCEFENIDDAEVKTEFFTYCDTFKVGGGNFRIHDEIKISNIVNVSNASGYIIVDNVSVNSAEVLIGGKLFARVLYLDKNGEYRLASVEVPFEESVESEGIYDSVFVKCSAEKIFARVIGEEFELAALEAQIKYEIFSQAEKSIALSVDAYSPQNPFECITESKELFFSGSETEISHKFSENITLDDNAESIERILFCTAANNMITASALNGVMEAEGIAGVNCVYVCEKGMTHCIKKDIPYKFETTVSPEINMAIIADEIYINADAVGSGKNLEICISAAFRVELMHKKEVCVIEKIRPCEQIKPKHGIVIYTPSKNETLFDIGKRFSISTASLLKSDSEIESKIKEGRKIVLLS